MSSLLESIGSDLNSVALQITLADINLQLKTYPEAQNNASFASQMFARHASQATVSKLQAEILHFSNNQTIQSFFTLCNNLYAALKKSGLNEKILDEEPSVAKLLLPGLLTLLKVSKEEFELEIKNVNQLIVVPYTAVQRPFAEMCSEAISNIFNKRFSGVITETLSEEKLKKLQHKNNYHYPLSFSEWHAVFAELNTEKKEVKKLHALEMGKIGVGKK